MEDRRNYRQNRQIGSPGTFRRPAGVPRAQHGSAGPRIQIRPIERNRQKVAGSIRPATVLSPCDNERLPFRWTLNPYRGCAFACRYCYARYTHEWLGLDPGRGFDEEVLLKEDLAETLARDLARMRRRGRLGEAIAVGTATDPYQPAEHRFGLTRSCLEVLAEEEGHRLSITTKSDLVLRDIDILLGIGERNELRVNVTLTALDCSLARRLEPGAPSPRTRLSTIAALARGGVAVDTFVMPILPGITDGEAELDALFEAIALAGARAAHCQALFLRSPSREVFFAFLERRFPERLLEYRRLFGDNAHPPPLTVARLRARVERLRERHGLHGGPRSPSQRLPRRRRRRSPTQAPPRSPGVHQLSLFGGGVGAGGAGRGPGVAGRRGGWRLRPAQGSHRLAH